MRQQQDDWQKAECRLVLRAVQVRQVAPLRALLMFQPVPDDELG